jgi:hypothetical protein
VQEEVLPERLMSSVVLMNDYQSPIAEGPVKWLRVVEVVATPLTYVVVSALKRAEGVNAYDRKTNFNPFAVAES